jgi:hypothetical protein
MSNICLLGEGLFLEAIPRFVQGGGLFSLFSSLCFLMVWKRVFVEFWEQEEWIY